MINLVPMTEADYQVYLAKIIPEYAVDKVQAGNWTEAESLERSRKTFEYHLSQGIHTPGNFVGRLVNENGESVGFLWYELTEKRPETAFIFDFEILTPFRRLGYGVQALLALEAHVRARGVKRIELHVFGNNTAARELYKKVGYSETDISMAREI
jgi:ribosomal protein S18 acetylase RimI-like enzyme